jgi:hypothetical protein
VAVVTDLLVGLPIVVTFLLLASVWALLALLLIWVGNRFISDHVREVSGNGVLNTLAIVASFYAFLVGFIVVQEWGKVSDAKEQVSIEAASLATAVFAISTLPPPYSVNLYNSLFAFVRSEVCDEIPYLATATRQDPRTTVALQKLYQVMADVRPVEVTLMPGYGQAFSSIADAATARRQLVNAASERVPVVLVIAIVLVGFVLLTAVSLQDVRHGKAHVITVLAVALFIALGETLVVSLNRPFAGAAAISSAPLTDGLPPKYVRCKNPVPVTAPSAVSGRARTK